MIEFLPYSSHLFPSNAEAIMVLILALIFLLLKTRAMLGYVL